MHSKPDQPNNEVISYQKLRAFIGLTGILLPILTVFGSLLFEAGKYALQTSISHYYYTYTHVVFVGLLGVLGGFLLTYHGHSSAESRTANIAGASALGIAAFPTPYSGFIAAPNNSNQYLQLRTEVSEVMGWTHYGCAFILFVCFILFCLKFFQVADEKYEGKALTKFEKRQWFYKLCGYGILVSIVLIPVFSLLVPRTGVFLYSTFFFETTALWFFGAAWLIKGSAIWKNKMVVKQVVKIFR